MTEKEYINLTVYNNLKAIESLLDQSCIECSDMVDEKELEEVRKKLHTWKELHHNKVKTK
jgi:hypothetical protein